MKMRIQMSAKYQESAVPHYWQQRPFPWNNPSCWAGAPSTREKRGQDGLTPFMREQWALAAPGYPCPDMEEVLASLNVTPSHHVEHLVCWTKETWQSLPRNALVAISAVLYVLLVKPAIAIRKFLDNLNWPNIYLVLGILIWIRFTSNEAAPAPAPRPRYETVVSYYLVPDVKGWCTY